MVFKLEQGRSGLWFLTSAWDPGLLIATTSWEDAFHAVPQALRDLATARADLAGTPATEPAPPETPNGSAHEGGEGPAIAHGAGRKEGGT